MGYVTLAIIALFMLWLRKIIIEDLNRIVRGMSDSQLDAAIQNANDFCEGFTLYHLERHRRIERK